MTGAITGYIDVAQLCLYAFWLFFAGLVFYLRREDRREGYPLESDVTIRRERPRGDVFPLIPAPKTFRFAAGRSAVTGRKDAPELKLRRTAPWPGAPLEPTGNPMLDGVGPAAYALREDVPERTYHGEPNIVPLRVAADHWIDPQDPDPRGMTVIGADDRPRAR